MAFVKSTGYRILSAPNVSCGKARSIILNPRTFGTLVRSVIERTHSSFVAISHHSFRSSAKIALNAKLKSNEGGGVMAFTRI